MWVFYLFACLPLLVGGVLYYMNERVVWWEYFGAFGLALLTAVIFQCIAVVGLTRDTETWSGQIDKAVFYPEWQEEYQQMHTETTTDSDGNSSTRVWYTTEYRWHWDEWGAETTLGNGYGISETFFNAICKNFNSRVTEPGFKPGFHQGDPNIYVSYNTTGFIYPVNKLFSFENRIKAAPTLFSFVKVPETAPVFAYPESIDWQTSGRLLGSALRIPILEWDRMNARLGPRKKVNVIMIGFPAGTSTDLGVLQQAKWIGGKKNDLVLCFGEAAPGQTSWAFVFGWSESELVKRNLETLLLSHPVGADLIPAIEAEINANYTKKDWHKFDYITIEPPAWSYWVFGIVLLGSQAGFWYWAQFNEFDKIW